MQNSKHQEMIGKRIFLLLLTVCCSLVEASRTKASQKGAPVIFVPGDLGSPIDAKLDRATSSHGCPTKRDWYRLWLRIEDFLPGRISCLIENLSLVFDPATNTSHNPKGVQTRVPGWGTSHVVEYVDDSFLARILHVANDAAPLVKELLKWGYERDVSFRGAPYDFRFAMASQPQWFDKLRQLIEDTWKINGNRKVAVMSHSLGGLYTTWFLNHQSTEWKAKFIHSFIPFSTPWGGSNKALLALTSGNKMHIPTVRALDARRLQRTIETNYLVLPNYRFFESGKVFLYTKDHNYTLTSDDVDVYFKATRNPIGKIMYQKIFNENRKVAMESLMPPHPGVKTHCFFGSGIATNSAFHYWGNFPDGEPKAEKGDGDGAATHESLRGCMYWLKQTGEWNRNSGWGNEYNEENNFTEVHQINGASHLEIMSDKRVLEKLRSILFKI